MPEQSGSANSADSAVSADSAEPKESESAHSRGSGRLTGSATTDLSPAGARSGAIVDVVPAHRFEPDDGVEDDVGGGVDMTCTSSMSSIGRGRVPNLGRY